jgi:hypothetical protein
MALGHLHAHQFAGDAYVANIVAAGSGFNRYQFARFQVNIIVL